MCPEATAILRQVGQRLLVCVLVLWPGMAFATCSLGTGWELLQYESFSPFENPPVVAAIGIGDKAVKPAPSDEDERPYILRFALFDKQCRVLFQKDYPADDAKVSLDGLRDGGKHHEVVHR